MAEPYGYSPSTLLLARLLLTYSNWFGDAPKGGHPAPVRGMASPGSGCSYADMYTPPLTLYTAPVM